VYGHRHTVASSTRSPSVTSVESRSSPATAVRRSPCPRCSSSPARRPPATRSARILHGQAARFVAQPRPKDEHDVLQERGLQAPHGVTASRDPVRVTAIEQAERMAPERAAAPRATVLPPPRTVLGVRGSAGRSVKAGRILVSRGTHVHPVTTSPCVTTRRSPHVAPPCRDFRQSATAQPATSARWADGAIAERVRDAGPLFCVDSKAMATFVRPRRAARRRRRRWTRLQQAACARNSRPSWPRL